MAVHPLKGVGGLQIRGRPWFCHRVRAVRVAHAMYGSQRFFCFSVAVAQTIVRTVGGVNHVAKARNPFAAMLLFQNPPVVAKITARAAYPSGINAHYMPVSTAWFQ
ncbi:hypothetical protein A9Q95_07640 [Rhodobacterales bacterium 59_46_T64]|nr:hypothetical protein A9Q95_07640 [Rhodobacterales bacterium 59_46_T64]